MDRLDDKVVFLVAGGWVAVVAIFAAFSLLDKKKESRVFNNCLTLVRSQGAVAH